MQRLYLLCGIQGSGKSTYALNNKEKLNAEVVSTDRIRLDYSPIEEKDVFPTAYKLISEKLLNGNVIFDATNITKCARKNNLDCIFRLIDKKNVEVVCVCFICDKDICKMRVEKRNKLQGEIYLPLEVIDNYSERFELPSLKEGFKEIIYVK